MITDVQRNKVRESFLNKMQAVFTPPRQAQGERLAMANAEYEAALARFSHVELTAGWEILRSRYKRSTWPSIGECVEACRDRRKAKQDKVITQTPKRSKVMKTPEAQQALRENWGRDYWLLVLKYGPDLTGRPGQPRPNLSPEQMKARCRNAAKEIDRLIDAVKDDPKLSKLGRHLKTKNEEYRQRFDQQRAHRALEAERQESQEEQW